jgi:ubiquinone/menaquinone biosynthesis C-methylase UbiE
MKLGFLERFYLNSLFRHLVQRPLEFRMITKGAPFPHGAHVLEIGCGNGAGLAELARRVKPAALTGVDADPAQLRRARTLLARKNIPAQLIEADATAIPLPAHSYDVITDIGCIHHIENWQKALSEVARLLRHGGVFYSIEFYAPLLENKLFRTLFPHPADRFSHKQLLEELPRHGLTPLAERNFAGLAGFIVARLTANPAEYD